MAKTYQFTENASGEPISIVLDQIQSFRRDGFSGCTTITLASGKEIGVTASIEAITNLIAGKTVDGKL